MFLDDKCTEKKIIVPVCLFVILESVEVLC